MSAQTERRTLKMHPRLLWDVIHRQAGTLSKAILEGVMNSVDAGATFCDVTIDRERFSISDDGKGFANDEEITKFFETFGFPHEEGDAKYGRFRMGRGQMMAFGRNEWRTNTYRMLVDLKPQKNELGEDYALGYEFQRVNEKAKGCSVTVNLYDKLSPSALDAVIREIGDYVKYVHIPVRLNGKVISVDPKNEKWDEETPDAYIKRKANGTLDVYNQGVLVNKIPNYRHGVSGVVVSKEALEVNFARNDVQSTCPRWKRIVRHLNEETMQQAKRNAPLTDAQRDFFARQLASGETTLSELNESRIVTDITGSHHPFSIFSRLSRFQNNLSIAVRGDRVAEMAHTRRLGFFVTDECAERFGASTAEELKKVIDEIHRANKVYGSVRAVERSHYDTLISSSHEPIADKELNKAERLALAALREASKTVHWYGTFHDRNAGRDVFLKGYNHGPRKISVGASETALAWTDGVHNIWFERGTLKYIKNGHKGMMQLASIMLHEYLHNGPSTGTHEHGVEFYNRFHDLAVHTTVISDAADVMFKAVLKEMRKNGAIITQTLSRHEDRITEMEELGIKSEPSLVPEDEAQLPEEEPAVEERAMAAVEHAPLSKPIEEDIQKAAPAKKPSRRKIEDENQLPLKF